MVLDASRLDQGPTSTIVELKDGVEIHREGPIKKEQIEKTLRE